MAATAPVSLGQERCGTRREDLNLNWLLLSEGDVERRAADRPLRGLAEAFVQHVRGELARQLPMIAWELREPALPGDALEVLRERLRIPTGPSIGLDKGFPGSVRCTRRERASAQLVASGGVSS